MMFSISYISLTMICLILTAYVYLSNSKRILNKSWFFLNLSVAVWSFGLGLMACSQSSRAALFWVKIHYAGASFIPAAYYHFICSLLDSYDKRRKIDSRLLYLTSLLFLLLTYSGNLFTQLSQQKFNLQSYASAVPLYIFYALFFLVTIGYSIGLLLKKHKQLKGYKRNQIEYIIIASFIGFIGGAASFLQILGIDLYSYGVYFVFLCQLIITYAIVHYSLMNIFVIIRQALIRQAVISSGIFGLLIGAFVFGMIFVDEFLSSYLGRRQFIVPFCALFIVIFIAKPVERIVSRITGNIFFKRRYEYKKALVDAASGMVSIREPKELFNLIVHMVSRKVRTKNAILFVYNENSDEYELKASRGIGRPPSGSVCIKRRDPIIEWIKEKREPLSKEDVEFYCQKEDSVKEKNVFVSNAVSMLNIMNDLRAVICVPISYQNDLIGLFLCGEKRTGSLFSQDELEFYNALTEEAAIAIRNAQLYDELNKRADEINEMHEKEQRLIMHTAIAFAAAVDARDPYTHGHSERVTNYSEAIFENMGHNLSEKEHTLFQQRMRIAAALHDIGKIAISDSILHKPKRLTEKEKKIIQIHPIVGAEIVSRIKGLKDIVGGIKYHHERYDGSGYPEQLKGEDIPIMARIIAVADVYDAMISDRPYRRGIIHELVKDEITINNLIQFDPFVVAAFLKAVENGQIEAV